MFKEFVDIYKEKKKYKTKVDIYFLPFLRNVFVIIVSFTSVKVRLIKQIQ